MLSLTFYCHAEINADFLIVARCGRCLASVQDAGDSEIEIRWGHKVASFGSRYAELTNTKVSQPKCTNATIRWGRGQGENAKPCSLLFEALSLVLHQNPCHRPALIY